VRKPIVFVGVAGLVFLCAGAALAARPSDAPAVPPAVNDPHEVIMPDAQDGAAPVAPRYVGPPEVITPYSAPIAPAVAPPSPPAREPTGSPAPSASADRLPPGPPTTHR